MLKRNYAVDLIKCFAIIAVILCHTAQRINDLPDVVFGITKLGQLGVQAFFVMSAYLCCKSAKHLSNRKDIKEYLIKKFLRLAPAYYFGIVLYVSVFCSISAIALPVRIYTNINPLDVFLNVILLNNLSPTACNSVVPGGWSIGCLWLFFVLFPILFRLCKNTRKTVECMLWSNILILLFGGFHYIFGYEIKNNGFVYFSIVTQLPCFIMGILIYRIEESEQYISPCWRLMGPISVALTVGFFYWDIWLSWLILPLLTSVVVTYLYALLRKKENKESQAVKQISGITMSMFIFHPLFAYYGISYTNKIAGHFGIQINPIVMYLLSSLVVIGITYIVSIKAEKLFELPLNIYRNK